MYVVGVDIDCVVGGVAYCYCQCPGFDKRRDENSDKPYIK